MLVELGLGDVLIPSPLIYALVSVALFIVLDRVGSMFGIYRLFWHPALARVALWVCVFSGLVGLSREGFFP